MGLVEETETLRTRLAGMAAEPEWSLLSRYDLLKEKQAKSLSVKWYQHARKIVAKLGLAPPYVTKYPWLGTLKHSSQDSAPMKTVLIWALGIKQEYLRTCCEGFQKRFAGASAIVPILVTDVSDFYYFSRLKWLVEYVPELSGVGRSYSERKQQYLAWCYRDAVVVPVSVGNANDEDWNAIMGIEN